MELPARLTVHSSRYVLDGGTAVLQATDEAGSIIRLRPSSILRW